MASNEKKYGLIDPKKKVTVADVFNNDSDSGDERGSKDWIKKKLQKDAERGLKKQTVIDMNRALMDDPTVYQYDEVYETIKEKEAEVSKPKAEKKVKYMDALLKTADRRKKENERRTERLVQKEREAEGEMFKDKEEFITSSYRQKLEEIKKAEEEEKKMEYIESVMDVTKQQDLGSFYRQLYKETVPEAGSTPQVDLETIKKEPNEEESKAITKTKQNKKSDSSSSGSSGSDSSSDDSSSSSSESGSGGEENLKKKNIEDCSKPAESEVKKPDPARITALEDGEIASASASAAEEDKQPAVVTVETNVEPAKFDISGRRDRTYRQREPALKENDVKKVVEKEHSSSTSGHRRDERVHARGNDDERSQPPRDARGHERDRGRERDRDRARRDGQRDRPAWRSDDRRDGRSDSRRQRSRSRTRRDQDDSRSPRRNFDKKDNRRPRDRPDDDSARKGKVSQHQNDGGEQKLNSKLDTEIAIKAEEKPSREKEEKTKPVAKPTSNGTAATANDKENVQVAPREDIWKKRTVGEAFETALMKYYQRKAQRGG